MFTEPITSRASLDELSFVVNVHQMVTFLGYLSVFNQDSKGAVALKSGVIRVEYVVNEACTSTNLRQDRVFEPNSMTMFSFVVNALRAELDEQVGRWSSHQLAPSYHHLHFVCNDERCASCHHGTVREAVFCRSLLFQYTCSTLPFLCIADDLEASRNRETSLQTSSECLVWLSVEDLASEPRK